MFSTICLQSFLTYLDTCNLQPTSQILQRMGMSCRCNIAHAASCMTFHEYFESTSTVKSISETKDLPIKKFEGKITAHS